jgi:hypothetical protein
MRALSFTTLAIPTVFVLAAVAPSSAARPELSPRDAASARTQEVHRLQVRLDSVLTELRAHDVSRLTAVQRARRESLVEILEAYNDRGEFPHNYDFPGQAIPYFVDRETGVVCAVGHLLEQSGRRDIVDRVAAMNNNVWVRELAGDSAFTSWLDTHGLTLAEAARIQAPYIGDPPPMPTVVGNPFPTAASVALGGALIASYWNARPNAAGTSRVGNALGMIAGAAAIGTGAAVIGDRGTASMIGAASLSVGAASTWLATRNVIRYRRVAEQKRAAERASVAPVIPMDGSSGAGIMITLRF